MADLLQRKDAVKGLGSSICRSKSGRRCSSMDMNAASAKFGEAGLGSIVDESGIKPMQKKLMTWYLDTRGLVHCEP
jgi:hypothetical protein